ncbi:uncharacterized protein F5891DRAFT_950362, partial [Suillus fuscotomentosus]
LRPFMLASKVICDNTYSNKSWPRVSQGMFQLREINQVSLPNYYSPSSNSKHASPLLEDLQVTVFSYPPSCSHPRLSVTTLHCIDIISFTCCIYWYSKMTWKRKT